MDYSLRYASRPWGIIEDGSPGPGPGSPAGLYQTTCENPARHSAVSNWRLTDLERSRRRTEEGVSGQKPALKRRSQHQQAPLRCSGNGVPLVRVGVGATRREHRTPLSSLGTTPAHPCAATRTCDPVTAPDSAGPSLAFEQQLHLMLALLSGDSALPNQEGLRAVEADYRAAAHHARQGEGASVWFGLMQGVFVRARAGCG